MADKSRLFHAARLMRRGAVLLAMLLALVITKTSGGEHKVVDVARKGVATPWISVHAAENSAVVPLSSIPMLAGIPFQTEYYQIDPKVVESGYFYYYYVRGKRNDYVVESTVRLLRLLNELAIVEELAKHDPAGEFFAGVGQGVKGIGVGAAHLITKPGQSLRNAGNSVGRLFKGASPTGKDDRGDNRGRLGDGPMGGERRKLAYKHHLDVYSDNPEVRHVLNVLATARSIGSVATWAIPASTVGVFAAGRVRDDVVELFIRDLDPDNVRAEVGKRLAPVFGMNWNDPHSSLGRFIRNPNYTPRQIAYIGKYLEGMAGIRDLRLSLDLLAQEATPEIADLAYIDLRLHYILHTRIQPIAAFIELENLAAVQGTNGEFYLIFPGDVMNSWSFTDAEISELIAEARSRQATALNVVALGVVEPEFARMLQGKGVKVYQNLLRDPRFLEVADK